MVTSGSQIPWLPLVSSRREFLRVSCASAFAIGTTAGIVSCASAASPGSPSSAGSPETTIDSLFGHDWLQRLAIAIAATEITHILESGLEGTAWAAWDAGVEAILEDALTAALLAMDSGFAAGGRGEEPRFSPVSTGRRFIPDDHGWADQVPPVVMAQVSQVPHGDPRTDHLVACVDTGKTKVIFAPWAWQALWLYVQDLTKNQTGADLDTATTLCRRRLIPSGTVTGPEVGEDRLIYEALDGTVEIALISRSGGGSTVTITAPPAKGITGSLLQKQFKLPAA
jgi:hypothetical protein